jgi:hypothetical protein
MPVSRACGHTDLECQEVRCESRSTMLQSYSSFGRHGGICRGARTRLGSIVTCQYWSHLRQKTWKRSVWVGSWPGSPASTRTPSTMTGRFMLSFFRVVFIMVGIRPKWNGGLATLRLSTTAISARFAVNATGSILTTDRCRLAADRFSFLGLAVWHALTCPALLLNTSTLATTSRSVRNHGC